MHDQLPHDLADALAKEGLEYLQGLQTTLAELEHDILALTSPTEAPEALQRIARTAHSIKGTAGSYKFDLITTICHRLEDRVLAHKLNTAHLDTHIDGLLRYVDAISSCAEAYREDDQELIEKLRHIFRVGEKPSAARLPAPELHQRQRVLVVERLGALLLLINGAIKEYNSSTLDIAVASSGYDGLGRLLREHFDCVIMSNLSDMIKGIELIQILTAIKNPNQTTPFILLTSDQTLSLPQHAPKTYVIGKGGDLNGELKKTLTQVLGKSPSSQKTPTHRISLEKVLVVDDSLPIQRLVQMVLQKSLNLNVTVAANGREGLAAIENERPDLAILDFQLPDMDGVELAQQIRARYSDLPFIFLTAADNSADHARLLSVGPEIIIKKPFPPMDLINWLKGFSAARKRSA